MTEDKNNKIHWTLTLMDLDSNVGYAPNYWNYDVKKLYIYFYFHGILTINFILSVVYFIG
jgi:hypothetical protein